MVPKLHFKMFFILIMTFFWQCSKTRVRKCLLSKIRMLLKSHYLLFTRLKIKISFFVRKRNPNEYSEAVENPYSIKLQKLLIFQFSFFWPFWFRSRKFRLLPVRDIYIVLVAAIKVDLL